MLISFIDEADLKGAVGRPAGGGAVPPRAADSARDHPDSPRDHTDSARDQPEAARDQPDSARDQLDSARDHTDGARDQPEIERDQPDIERDQLDIGWDGDSERDRGDSAREWLPAEDPDPVPEPRQIVNRPGRPPLQVWPLRKLEEFESMSEFLAYIDECNRWNNGLPPRPPPLPEGEQVRPGVPLPTEPRTRREARSRQLGVRLATRDFELLEQLAAAHAVPPSTMARMLIARGVRAAAERN